MDIIQFDLFKHIIDDMLNNPYLSDSKLKSKVSELLNHIPFAHHDLNPGYLVRATLLDKGEPCKNISRCSYNPIASKIPLQRCNYEGQQLFYSTVPCKMVSFPDAGFPSILETTFQRIEDDPLFDGREVVATVWKVNRYLKVWSLPFHSSSIEKNQDFNLIYTEFIKVINQASAGNMTIIEDYTNKLKFLSKLFCIKTKNPAVYRVTSMIHNEVLNFFKTKGFLLDGLIYPAAYSNGEGMSLVLNKEVIDNKDLNCIKAIKYALIRHKDDYKKIDFPILGEATPNTDGSLHFKPLMNL